MSLLYDFNQSADVEKVTMKWPCDEYIIPAGTPMSRTGIANDENAIGILAAEARVEFSYPLSIAPHIGKKEPKGNKDYTFFIITGGFVNLKDAEASYGEKISDAAKEAMTGIKFVNEDEPSSFGGGDPVLDENGKLLNEVLPEGYPYDNSIILVPEQTITTEVYPEFADLSVAQLAIVPIEGETYNVIFNGDAYSLKANEGGLLGNVGLESGEDTGEPFLIANGMIVTATPMTFTISVLLKKITKLDDDFLSGNVVLYGTVGALTRIDWDGNTTGLDHFTDNGCVFYKVSDFTVPYSQISSVKAERSDGYETDKYGQTQYGWLANGYTAAVVTDAENNNIPSNGVYFRYARDKGLRCLWMEIDTHKENSILYLNSPSGKKYAITVDDSGTLTATEITE